MIHQQKRHHALVFLIGGNSGYRYDGDPGGTSVSRPSSPPTAAGRDELRALVDGCKDFGMFSMIRALLFRGWPSSGLAVLSIMLLAGQWAGPFGFIAFKIRMLELNECPG